MVGLVGAVALAAAACSVAHAQTPPQNAAHHDAGASTTAPSTGGGSSGASATGAWMNVRPPRTTPGITPDSVHRLLSHNESAILDCYRTLLGTDAHAHGLLTIHLDVIAGGTADIGRVRFAPRNEPLEQCVTGVLQRAEWPNPRGVPSTTVDAQIDLAPTAPPLTGHAAPHH